MNECLFKVWKVADLTRMGLKSVDLSNPHLFSQAIRLALLKFCLSVFILIGFLAKLSEPLSFAVFLLDLQCR